MVQGRTLRCVFRVANSVTNVALYASLIREHERGGSDVLNNARVDVALALASLESWTLPFPRQ